MGSAEIETKQASKIQVWFWMLLILLAGIKIWLLQGQALSAIINSIYDDQLYIALTTWILKGQWLGPYNYLTLAKGPFYPIWIALSFLSGIPLLLTQHLLYIAACFVFIFAIHPLFNTRYIYLLPAYILLLFNPISYTNYPMTRVLREEIYLGLTVLVISCALGLFLRQVFADRKPTDDGLWTSVFYTVTDGGRWAIGLGLMTGLFWLTREEGVWILPFIAILLGFTLFKVFKTSSKEGLRKVSWWAVALFIWGAVVCVLCATNYFYYGVFSKTELDAHSFKAAYGALARVKPAQSIFYVPVTKETRLRIYAVSPAFAELQPFLEGQLGQLWGLSGPKNEQNKNEINGGVFVWAFREAVSAAGYYSTGKYPGDYYTRLAHEINTACTEGKLDCFRERASLSPAWHNEYLISLIQNIWQAVKFSTRMDGFSATPSYSVGPEEGLNLFRDLTRERLAEPPQELFHINGWAVKEGVVVGYSVKDAHGESTQASIDLSPSPDVYQYFFSQGKDIPNANYARFSIATPCIENCTLEIRSSDSILISLPLNTKKLTTGWASRGEFFLHIDSFSIQNKVDALSAQHRSDTIKLNILGRIGKVYQSTLPILVVLSLFIYIYLGLCLFKKNNAPGIWIILTALAASYFSRLALISFITITSWPATDVKYLAPASPLLLMFVALSLTTGGKEIFNRVTKRCSLPSMTRQPTTDDGQPTTDDRRQRSDDPTIPAKP